MWIIAALTLVVGTTFMVVGTASRNTAAVSNNTNGLRRSQLTRVLGMILILAGAALVVTQLVLPGV